MKEYKNYIEKTKELLSLFGDDLKPSHFGWIDYAEHEWCLYNDEVYFLDIITENGEERKEAYSLDNCTRFDSLNKEYVLFYGDDGSGGSNSIVLHKDKEITDDDLIEEFVETYC